MKKIWFFEKRYSGDFHIILLELALWLYFWSKKSFEIKWWLTLFLHDVKTSRESNDMLTITIQCVYLPTSHQKDEKMFFFSNFDAYLASFLTTLKTWQKCFSRPKKIGGNLFKIQTLAVGESVIDVLSEKLNIILMWQV